MCKIKFNEVTQGTLICAFPTGHGQQGHTVVLGLSLLISDTTGSAPAPSWARCLPLHPSHHISLSPHCRLQAVALTVTLEQNLQGAKLRATAGVQARGVLAPALQYGLTRGYSVYRQLPQPQLEHSSLCLLVKGSRHHRSVDLKVFTPTCPCSSQPPTPARWYLTLTSSRESSPLMSIGKIILPLTSAIL
jgi:hypothetical protein